MPCGNDQTCFGGSRTSSPYDITVDTKAPTLDLQIASHSIQTTLNATVTLPPKGGLHFKIRELS